MCLKRQKIEILLSNCKNCARIGSVGSADTAPHSLALKLRKACFRLLIVEPVTPRRTMFQIKRAVHKPILKRTTRVRLNIGWSARIRTMIKRTKISCPTIRRRSNDTPIIYVFCFFSIKKFNMCFSAPKNVLLSVFK